MKALHHHLLDALLLDEVQGFAAWSEWREKANLDRLDDTSFRLLTALAGRLEVWLERDPQREIFIGICRRGWSQTQLRRALLAELISTLAAAGVYADAAGPVAWADRYWPQGAVRHIESLNLDVAPHDVNAAVGALVRAGWKIDGRNPGVSGFWLRFAPPLRLRHGTGADVRVHWRSLPNTDIVLPELGSMTVREARAEHDLIRVLGCEYGDGLHWTCDAAMICRGPIDWDEMGRLLQWRYLAKTRLHEMQPGLVARTRLGIAERVFTLPLRTFRRVRGG